MFCGTSFRILYIDCDIMATVKMHMYIKGCRDDSAKNLYRNKGAVCRQKQRYNMA